MFIVDGIAYASEKTEDISITEIKLLEDRVIIVTFNTGEQRLLDVTELYDIPGLTELKDDAVYNSAYIDFGTIVWKNGELDLSPESIYNRSYPYEKEVYLVG